MKLNLIGFYDKIAKKYIDIKATTDDAKTIAEVNYQYILDHPEQHDVLMRFEHHKLGTANAITGKIKTVKPYCIYDNSIGVREAKKQLKQLKEIELNETQNEQTQDSKDVQA